MDNNSESIKSDSVKMKNSLSPSSGPNGGFPPIYLCDKAELEKENLEKREFTIKKQLISIKDILQMRKIRK